MVDENAGFHFELIDKPFKCQTIVGAVFNRTWLVYPSCAVKNRTYLLYAFDLFCLSV